jgi:hypothetical protein
MLRSPRPETLDIRPAAPQPPTGVQSHKELIDAPTRDKVLTACRVTVTVTATPSARPSYTPALSIPTTSTKTLLCYNITYSIIAQSMKRPSTLASRPTPQVQATKGRKGSLGAITSLPYLPFPQHTPSLSQTPLQIICPNCTTIAPTVFGLEALLCHRHRCNPHRDVQHV